MPVPWWFTVKMFPKKITYLLHIYSWRRLLRTPWIPRRTNVSILEELNIQVRLSTKTKQLIIKYFGHVSRRKDDNKEKLMVQGKVEKTRRRRRSPKRRSSLQENLSRTALEARQIERNGGKLLKTQHGTNLESRRFKHEVNN